MSHHEGHENDITDFYAFRGEPSPEGATTALVMNISELTDPKLADNMFDPEATFRFHISRAAAQSPDNAVIDDYVLKATFPIVDGTQRVRMELLTGDNVQNPQASGELIVDNGELSIVHTGARGIRVYADRRTDPFVNDKKVTVPIATGIAPDFDGWSPETAENTFGGANVCALIVEVPITETGSDELATWATVVVHDTWQTQLAGKPFTHTTIFPEEETKNEFQASHPTDHRPGSKFHTLATERLIQVAETCGKRDPQAHAEHVVNRMLPDVLRYTPGTTAHWTASSENGRGLYDDVSEEFPRLYLGDPVFELGLKTETDMTGTLSGRMPWLDAPVVE